MQKYIFLFLVLTSMAHAQVETEITHVENYDPEDNPSKLPLAIDLSGKIHFTAFGGSPEIYFAPNAQFTFSRTTIHYVAPIPFVSFSLDESFPGQPLIEFKTKRLEYGAGLTFSGPFNLGVTPYKGSYVSTVTLRETGVYQRSTDLPRTLSALSEWNVNDSGHYQTYGGILVKASVGGVLSGAIGIQNQFVVGIKKTTESLVELTLAEEGIKSRKIRLGPDPLTVSMTFLHGNLFSSHFELDLTNPEHHVLYERALKGEIHELQKALPNRSQRVVWTGKDREFYFGVPSVAGEVRNWRDFNYGVSGDGLYMKQRRTTGFLTTFRDHRSYVFHDTKGVILLWTSKMKKVTAKTMEKVYLKRARTLNLRGFEQTKVAPKHFGSVIAHTGMAFSKAELTSVTDSDLETARTYMAEICMAEKLECQKTTVLNQIITRFRHLVKKPWNEAKRDLGVALSSEPVLITGLTLAKGWKKEAYVKFLSQRYQSFEGVTEVQLY